MNFKINKSAGVELQGDYFHLVGLPYNYRTVVVIHHQNFIWISDQNLI